MELVFSQLVALLSALWWPFCRVLAMLSAAPVIGDAMVPISVRVLLSFVLAVVLLPVAQPTVGIDPFSLHGVVATAEQALIGFGLGLAFHMTMAVMTVLGFMVSSQMGLSMAVMNDPMNGSSSDVVSTLLYMLCILVFFSVDGHLVLGGVVGASFKAWPVGAGLPLVSLHSIALNIAWVFSAALLLALPVIFSTLVVQLGFGFLNRVAPSLNLYSLGFSVVTLFGLFVLTQIVRFVPTHYVRMSERVLEMLQQNLKAVPHG
ncbi:flagellar biosynthetic protein FliR [Caldimonas brevitalea]|uniref:Flagellar biosynthetic protein FliR n=1 Tax=Caldimonas brevitalea TaxID=413882 RepID=A0A0G3BSM0_9BURK|nr:flagellar biosynthetic protein FliR [Caldimonas brevitalea]AKJ30376.1 flagellar biosynthesis protein FliR [Caldimonas brevitalea]